MATSFRDRVRIERPSEAVGVEGHTWTTVAESVACNVIGTGGGEMQRGRQTEEHISHLVEMRYRRDVNTTMRLVVLTGIRKGKVLSIDKANPIDRREMGQPPLLELHTYDEGTIKAGVQT